MAQLLNRDGVWHVRWYDCAGPGMPKKRRQKKVGTSKKAAVALAAKLEQDAVLKEHGLIKTATVEDAARLVEMWIAERENEGLNARYLDQMKTILDRAVKSLGVAVTQWNVPEFLSRFKTAKTYNNNLMVIRQFTRWASMRGNYGDPCKGVQRRRREDVKRKRRVLTEAETDALYTTPRAEMYRFVLHTGIRSGELARLTWDDIDQEKRTWSVWSDKNKKRIELPLHPCLKLEGGEGLVYPRSPGVPYLAVIQRDWEALGVPYETKEGFADFYSLRHTFCTRLVLAGVSAAFAHKLMRHSTMDMTMRYYTHLKVADLATELDKLPG